jgi:hypothetical protein
MEIAGKGEGPPWFWLIDGVGVKFSQRSCKFVNGTPNETFLLLRSGCAQKRQGHSQNKYVSVHPHLKILSQTKIHFFTDFSPILRV